MANYGLDLSQKKKKGTHRRTALVIAFICFALVLGSVSTLLLWRSLDYDWNNIYKTGETTTGEPTAPSTTEATYSGIYNFAVAVTTDDYADTYFLHLISVDLGEKTVRVVPVDPQTSAGGTGKTYAELLAAKRPSEAVDALSGVFRAKVSRYAVYTESGFKDVLRAFGDLTVTIPLDVEYDTADMFLELSKGVNTLNADQTYKYMRYLCGTRSSRQAGVACADLVTAAFTSWYTAENNAAADDLFRTLVNRALTDITIVDFTESREEAASLVPVGASAQLKVYVADTLLTEESAE